MIHCSVVPGTTHREKHMKVRVRSRADCTMIHEAGPDRQKTRQDLISNDLRTMHKTLLPEVSTISQGEQAVNTQTGTRPTHSMTVIHACVGRSLSVRYGAMQYFFRLCFEQASFGINILCRLKIYFMCVSVLHIYILHFQRRKLNSYDLV